ncbi:hypothetical protein CRYUN_Cryun30bG0058400 [Craigia yunnanensis]
MEPPPPPPPQFPTSWSDFSSPPPYRPIRAPTINLPPNNNTQAIILAPVPQSQKVPTITPFHFQTPSKKITSPTTSANSTTPLLPKTSSASSSPCPSPSVAIKSLIHATNPPLSAKSSPSSKP